MIPRHRQSAQGKIRQCESSAEITSNDGFSMVADENYIATLMQKGVLLRFVEAVNLVDEQDGAAAKTGLSEMYSQRVRRAMSLASVVLPTPGGTPRNDRGQLVASIRRHRTAQDWQ
jgi:hypothetical protein